MKWKKVLFMAINKVPKKIKPKVKAFLNAVENHFSFLKDYGYIFIETKKATQYSVVNNIIEVSYQNDKLDRLIVIHYDAGESINEKKGFLDLSLYKGKDLHFGQLKFDMYLEKYNLGIDTDNLSYPNKNNKDTFKENIEASISGWAYFLKDIGINLINGTEWEDGLRFDWSSAEDILYQTQKDIIYGDDNKKEEDDDDDDDI